MRVLQPLSTLTSDVGTRVSDDKENGSLSLVGVIGKVCFSYAQDTSLN